MRISLIKQGPKIGNERLREFERWYGYDLPRDYRSFLLTYNGGRPERSVCVEVRGLPGGPTDLHTLHGLDRVASYQCLEGVVTDLAEVIPQHYLPVAHDEGGSYFCLACGEADLGAVIFLDDFLSQRPALYFVAKSFEEFLSRLRYDSLD